MSKSLSEEAAFHKALVISAIAHEGQKDLGGRMYMLHVLSVCGMLSSTEEKTVALLHDVVEDTPITLDQIRASGIPDNVVAAVDALTKRPKEDYIEDYIPRIAKAGPMAIRVKLADLKDNMSDSRPSEGSEQRMMRYIKAKNILSTALSNYPVV